MQRPRGLGRSSPDFGDREPIPEQIEATIHNAGRVLGLDRPLDELL